MNNDLGGNPPDSNISLYDRGKWEPREIRLRKCKGCGKKVKIEVDKKLCQKCVMKQIAREAEEDKMYHPKILIFKKGKLHRVKRSEIG